MSALPNIVELASLAQRGAPLVPGHRGPRTGRGWCLPTLRGRLVEISSVGTTATLSAAAALVYEAQRRGEPTAWITAWQATFFPPDLEACGIDLGALPVVWNDEVRSAVRTADELLRSGAFGLVVIDLGPHRNVPLPVQARLSGLVKRYQSTLLFLTHKRREAGSLGSLISLRCAGAKWRSAFNRFTWELDVLKDKRQGPGWRHEEVCHGPDGLC